MSVGLILVIALLTYASRAFALVLMPQPPARMRLVLDRLPAPLFASLAAISLVPEGGAPEPTVVAAALGALAATPTRSLLWVLAGGFAGYAVGAFLFV